MKVPNFTFCVGCEHQTMAFLFFSDAVRHLEFNSRKNCQHLTHWTRWNKRNKVWSSMTFLFKCIFFVAVTIRRCSLKSLLLTVEVHIVWIVCYCQASKSVNTWIIRGNTFTVFVTTHSRWRSAEINASKPQKPQTYHRYCLQFSFSMPDLFLPCNTITFWPKQFPQHSHY